MVYWKKIIEGICRAQHRGVGDLMVGIESAGGMHPVLHAFPAFAALVRSRPEQQHDAAVFAGDLFDDPACGANLHVGRAPTKPPGRRGIALADEFPPKALLGFRAHQVDVEVEPMSSPAFFDARQYCFQIRADIGRLHARVG